MKYNVLSLHKDEVEVIGERLETDWDKYEERFSFWMKIKIISLLTILKGVEFTNL